MFILMAALLSLAPKVALGAEAEGETGVIVEWLAPSPIPVELRRYSTRQKRRRWADRQVVRSPRERDEILATAGLSEWAHSKDDLERDLLLLEARELPQAELEARRPELNPAVLKSLKLRLEASKR